MLTIVEDLQPGQQVPGAPLLENDETPLSGLNHAGNLSASPKDPLTPRSNIVGPYKVNVQVRLPNSLWAFGSIGFSMWGLVNPFHTQSYLEDLFVRKAVYLLPNSITLFFFFFQVRTQRWIKCR